MLISFICNVGKKKWKPKSIFLKLTLKNTNIFLVFTYSTSTNGVYCDVINGVYFDGQRLGQKVIFKNLYLFKFLIGF